jgi:hypothetical protein
MSEVFISLDPLTGGATIVTDEGCEVLSAFPNTPICDLWALGASSNADWLQRKAFLEDLQDLETEVQEKNNASN